MALRSETRPVGKGRPLAPPAAIGRFDVVSGDVASADVAQARATLCADIP
jgi:hypothetical protein